MPTVNGVKADHHKYVPDFVDAEVVERQSRLQATQKHESSWVHYHARDVDCYGHKHKDYGMPTVIEMKTVTELPS